MSKKARHSNNKQDSQSIYNVSKQYGYKCRVGNWQEDYLMEDYNKEEFLKKKSFGELNIQKFQKKRQHCLKPIDITNSHDGYIHFGDNFMLSNNKNNGFISINIDEDMMTEPPLYSVTSSKLVQGAVLRNVLSIEPYQSCHKKGDVLKYGDKFHICFHPLLSNRLIIAALPVEDGEKPPYNTVFEILYHQASSRLVHIGSPIEVNKDIVLLHCLTKQSLYSDMQIYENYYGKEYECCCKIVYNQYRPLSDVMTGGLQVDRQEAIENFFKILI